MRWLPLRASLVLVAAFASLSAGQRSVETIDLAGSRYFISQTSPYVPTLNWFLAYQYCRTIGMELLSIGTAEEADLINSYLAANRLSNTDYWTSGNQLGSHLWMWMATGQRFNSSFNYWAAEEPFTKAGDSCLSVSNGGWVPQNCMDEKYFVCELTRCFFVNFVSAGRGSPQGDSSTSSGRHATQQQPQQQTTPRPEEQTAAQHESHQAATSQFTQPTMTTDRSFTVITTAEPTTYDEATFPTTEEPVKTMLTAFPKDRFEEQTVTPQTSPVKMRIMPGVTLDLEPAVHNNEIIQSHPINSLQLLMPPTREFSSSPSSSSSSSIPLQAEASTNFTVRRPISRKETFSWALLDQRSK